MVGEGRRAAHVRFACEACGVEETLPQVQVMVSRVVENMQRMWTEVKWENTHKEAYWRLKVDGIPMLGNSHMRGAAVTPCGCGRYPGAGAVRPTPRQHHFWGCGVAQAVVAKIEARLGTGLLRKQVRLAQPPAGVQQ